MQRPLSLTNVVCLNSTHWAGDVRLWGTKRTSSDLRSPVANGAGIPRGLGLILNGFHVAAAACSRVHRNSVPSTQMRWMITANRRAIATIAFFIPRCLAICMAPALSHDHFFERSMLSAAS